MKFIIFKLPLQLTFTFFMISIILLCNMYSVAVGEEINDRFEYDIEERYFIDDQINLTYDIKSLGLKIARLDFEVNFGDCLLYTSPSPRDLSTSRMPSSA